MIQMTAFYAGHIPAISPTSASTSKMGPMAIATTAAIFFHEVGKWSVWNHIRLMASR